MPSEEKPRRRPDLTIKVGTYRVTEDQVIDVRLCDGGVALSFCDAAANDRYTVIVDENGGVFFAEHGRLVRDDPDYQ
jgi:hypothetical protein